MLKYLNYEFKYFNFYSKSTLKIVKLVWSKIKSTLKLRLIERPVLIFKNLQKLAESSRKPLKNVSEPATADADAKFHKELQ